MVIIFTHWLTLKWYIVYRAFLLSLTHCCLLWSESINPQLLRAGKYTLIEKKPYFTKIVLNPILFFNINFKKYVHTDR